MGTLLPSVQMVKIMHTECKIMYCVSIRLVEIPRVPAKPNQLVAFEPHYAHLDQAENQRSAGTILIAEKGAGE